MKIEYSESHTKLAMSSWTMQSKHVEADTFHFLRLNKVEVHKGQIPDSWNKRICELPINSWERVSGWYMFCTVLAQSLFKCLSETLVIHGHCASSVHREVFQSLTRLIVHTRSPHTELGKLVELEIQVYLVFSQRNRNITWFKKKKSSKTNVATENVQECHLRKKTAI